MNLISADLDCLEIFYTYVDLLSRFVPLRKILNEVIKEEKDSLRKVILLAVYDYTELCLYMDMYKLIEEAMRDINNGPCRMGELIRAFDRWNSTEADNVREIVFEKVKHTWSKTTLGEYHYCLGEIRGY